MKHVIAVASAAFVAAVAAAPAQAATMINLQPYVNSNLSNYSGGSAYPKVSTTIKGIEFSLASSGTGTGIIQLGSNNLNSVTIAAAATAIDTAYVIINSAYGQNGRTSGTITFNGVNAGSPISLVQGVNIRDHFQNSQTNNSTSAFATANYNTGARFDVYRYDISALGGVLNTIGFSCNGTCNSDNGLPFLAGVTLTQEAVAAVPEPATWAMMLVGFGGIGFAMRRRKSKVTTTVAYA